MSSVSPAVPFHDREWKHVRYAQEKNLLIDTSARGLTWHIHNTNRYFYQVLQPSMALGTVFHNSDDSVDFNRVAPM